MPCVLAADRVEQNLDRRVIKPASEDLAVVGSLSRFLCMWLIYR